MHARKNVNKNYICLNCKTVNSSGGRLANSLSLNTKWESTNILKEHVHAMQKSHHKKIGDELTEQIMNNRTRKDTQRKQTWRSQTGYL